MTNNVTVVRSIDQLKIGDTIAIVSPNWGYNSLVEVLDTSTRGDVCIINKGRVSQEETLWLGKTFMDACLAADTSGRHLRAILLIETDEEDDSDQSSNKG